VFLENCPVTTQFIFNPNDLGHRKLLALAINEFASQPGNTVSGPTKKDGKGLVEELNKRGTPVSKTQIDRLKKAAPLRETYPPRDAGVVAQYLQETGYFPPGGDPHKTLEMLPVFFQGFGEASSYRLSKIVGKYVSYQYSNVDPDYIVSGNLTIGTPSVLRYAPVHEEARIKHNGSKMLIYDGIAFLDAYQVIYVLLREKTLQNPRFYLFDDIDGPGQDINMLFGTILSGARQHASHLSPVCLQRTDEASPYIRIHKSEISKLPEYVARYMSRPLAPGPNNGPAPR
jgi:hypothetical protein